MYSWLVVSTPFKNISQNGNPPQVGMKIKNLWNHQLDSECREGEVSTAPCQNGSFFFEALAHGFFAHAFSKGTVEKVF